MRQELERIERERCDSPGQSPLPEHNTTATTIVNVILDFDVPTHTPPLAITQAHLGLALNEWLTEHSAMAPRPAQ